MALTINIIRPPIVYETIPANSTVATIQVTGGTAPYTYSLIVGGEKFQISGGNIRNKEEMNSSNIDFFIVSVTDSTPNTPLSAASGSIYPYIRTDLQSKFNTKNVIYKIVSNFTLGQGTLVIPEGCTLDFQGGRLLDGTVMLNNTKVLPMGANIVDYIPTGIQGSFKEGQVIYDAVSKKLKLWNGAIWIDLGNAAPFSKGPTSDRPILSEEDSGSFFYDTTLRKYIVWSGTGWTNFDGSDLSGGMLATAEIIPV